jgi:tetratricopeptide (TPR) repeat protein
VFFQRGTELNQQRRFEEAIEQFTKAVRSDPKNHRYHQALFMTYLSTRRGRQGLETYKKMAIEHGTSSPVHYWLGRLYLQSGALEDAAREFRLSARLDPNDDHPWISLGHVYSRMGKDDDALRAYQEANRLSPNVAVVHAGLGAIYLRKNDDLNAWRELDKALRLDPSLSEARYSISLLYERRGELDRAMIEWQRLLDDDPNESNARERLARAYVAKKQYGNAVQHYSMLAQVRQASPEVFFALGESQVLLAASLDDPRDRADLVAAARESFQRVLELDPKHAEAKAYLERLEPRQE